MNETRHKASAILSGHKLRMLEDAGLTVVDKQRLDALERLYQSELQDESEMPHFERTVDPVWMILKELEAMDG